MAIDTNTALELIYKYTKQVKTKIVPIENGLNSIIAQNINAIHIMPRFNNSAMDGYGVKIDDASKVVEVIDNILAGSNKEPTISNNKCIKIMTGARVPSTVNAIVPYENVKILENNKIILPSIIKKEEHIRFAGEDIAKDELLVAKGEKITSSQITLLASQGITHIEVFKKPKVIVFASGEELKLHYDKTIEDYQLYNSNTPTLIARSKEFGCDVDFVGMAKDSVKSLVSVIEKSLHSDLIITSGGVSVGDADFTKEAFRQVGCEIIFDGIVVKPGKPTVFGKIGNTLVLNLPGNPLASSLIFEMFGKPLITQMTGANNIYHRSIDSYMSCDFKNKKGRTTIVAGYFNGSDFTPSKKHSAGMINILSKCNSMILLNSDVEFLAKNTKVNVLPLQWDFFDKEESLIETNNN